MAHPILATGRSGFGGRGYKVPGIGVDEVVPSVTTVLKVRAKDGLHQWIADQTAAWCVTHVAELQMLSDEVAHGRARWYWSSENVGEESRFYHEKVRDDHAELGTNVHEWVDAAIATGEEIELLTREAREMADAFYDWLMEHKVTRHHSEVTVVNTRSERRYAGTLDADWTIECVHEGEPCFGVPGPVRALIDLKSSRHTWPEHWMQLAALREADTMMVQVPEGTEGAHKAQKTEVGKKIVSWWISKPNPVYDRTAVLHIRPDDLDSKGNRISRFARLIPSTDDDLDYESFDGALRMVYADYKKKLRAKARAEGTEN
jgi:hypothetical protein